MEQSDQAKKVCQWMHKIIDRLYTMLITEVHHRPTLVSRHTKIMEFIYVEEL